MWTLPPKKDTSINLYKCLPIIIQGSRTMTSVYGLTPLPYLIMEKQIFIERGISSPLWREMWLQLPKLQMLISFDTAIPLLGINPVHICKCVKWHYVPGYPPIDCLCQHNTVVSLSVHQQRTNRLNFGSAAWSIKQPWKEKDKEALYVVT